MRSFVVWSLFVAVVFSSSACSFSASSKGSSNSSKSSSDVLSSPFTSSSGSSNPEGAYADEVKDFTASYLKSGGDASQLEHEDGKIAEKRGISDWESNEATYVGMGKGFHKAGLKQTELDGFKASLADNAQQAEWMQDGYDDRK